MSVLKRFTDIMSSNINALLDKAEDPVKMADQLARNLTSDLGKVKAETASVIAEEKRSKRELDECQAQVDKLMTYAKKAVEAGNDDDARKFLEKKAQVSENLTALQKKYDVAKANSERMREMYDKISEQLSEINARKSAIKAKMATAKMQSKINSLGSAMGSASSTYDAFSRMEEKADRALDEANAMAEMDNKPADETDDLMKKYDSDSKASSIDDELAALKGLNNNQ